MEGPEGPVLNDFVKRPKGGSLRGVLETAQKWTNRARANSHRGGEYEW